MSRQNNTDFNRIAWAFACAVLAALLLLPILLSPAMRG